MVVLRSQTNTSTTAAAAAAGSTTTGAPEKPAYKQEEEEEVSLQQRAVNAHAAISQIWPTDNDKIAPLEDVECSVLANAYTESWAPTAPAASSSSNNANHNQPTETSGVRLLVLAESHATTHRRLTGTRLADPTLAQRVGHRGHLNVVHCLSYGEPWMLEEQEKETAAEAPLGSSSSNEKDKMDATVQNGCKRGTPQFWRVLAALAGIVDTDNENNKDPLEGAEQSVSRLRQIFAALEGADAAHRESRVSAKLAVRQALMQRGILLADVSPVPIYAGGGVVVRHNLQTGRPYTTKENKLSDRVKRAILRTAFDEYAQYLIQRYRPAFVLLFGTSVETAIGRERLEETVQAVQGHYLGAIQHPSYNRIQGRKFLPHLRMLRSLARAVQPSERCNSKEELQAMIKDALAEEIVVPDAVVEKAVVEKAKPEKSAAAVHQNAPLRSQENTTETTSRSTATLLPVQNPLKRRSKGDPLSSRPLPTRRQPKRLATKPPLPPPLPPPTIIETSAARHPAAAPKNHPNPRCRKKAAVVVVRRKQPRTMRASNDDGELALSVKKILEAGRPLPPGAAKQSNARQKAAAQVPTVEVGPLLSPAAGAPKQSNPRQKDAAPRVPTRPTTALRKEAALTALVAPSQETGAGALSSSEQTEVAGTGASQPAPTATSGQTRLAVPQKRRWQPTAGRKRKMTDKRTNPERWTKRQRT